MFQFVPWKRGGTLKHTGVAYFTRICCNVLIGGIKACTNGRYLIIQPRKNVFISGWSFRRSLFAAFYARTFPANPKPFSVWLIVLNKLKYLFRFSFAVLSLSIASDTSPPAGLTKNSQWRVGWYRSVRCRRKLLCSRFWVARASLSRSTGRISTMNFTHEEIARPSRQIRYLCTDGNEFDWSEPSFFCSHLSSLHSRLPFFFFFFLRGIKYRPPIAGWR